MSRPTFDEFWVEYVADHSKLGTRILHDMGSVLVLVGFGDAAATRTYWLAPAAIVAGYACAFSGHFFVERNAPATFRHPIWAGIANWRAFGLRVAWAARTLGSGLRRRARRSATLRRRIGGAPPLPMARPDTTRAPRGDRTEAVNPSP